MEKERQPSLENTRDRDNDHDDTAFDPTFNADDKEEKSSSDEEPETTKSKFQRKSERKPKIA